MQTYTYWYRQNENAAKAVYVGTEKTVKTYIANTVNTVNILNKSPMDWKRVYKMVLDM